MREKDSYIERLIEEESLLKCKYSMEEKNPHDAFTALKKHRKKMIKYFKEKDLEAYEAPVSIRYAVDKITYLLETAYLQAVSPFLDSNYKEYELNDEFKLKTSEYDLIGTQISAKIKKALKISEEYSIEQKRIEERSDSIRYIFSESMKKTNPPTKKAMTGRRIKAVV